MIFPTKYKDQFGTEDLRIYSDGKTMRFTLREVEFEGKFFDQFEPTGNGLIPDHLHDRFCFVEDYGGNMPYHELSGFSMEVSIPVQLEIGKEGEAGEIRFSVEIKAEDQAELIDEEKSSCELIYSTGTFTVNGNLNFESCLAQLQKRLPPGHALKCCFSCRYSSYSPLGSQDFANLICFKTQKEGFLNCRNKDDFFNLVPFEKRKSIIYVQETWLCEEFEWIRKSDPWWYKDWPGREPGEYPFGNNK